MTSSYSVTKGDGLTVEIEKETVTHWGVALPYPSTTVRWCPTEGGWRDGSPYTEKEARADAARTGKGATVVTRTETVTTITETSTWLAA